MRLPAHLRTSALRGHNETPCEVPRNANLQDEAASGRDKRDIISSQQIEVHSSKGMNFGPDTFERWSAQARLHHVFAIVTKHTCKFA